MDKGFILLSRNIIESEVFASQKLLKIWVWCLCKSNFKDRSVPLKIGKGETVVNVKRGSFIFGRHKAEEELFIDGSTIYKSMKQLEKLEMISITSNNQYSIVKVNKYNDYQDTDGYKVTTKEQPSNNQVTAEEQPSNTTNTLKQVNKDKKEKEYIDSRKLKFAHTLKEFSNIYSREMLKDFYDYWTETNDNGKKFRREMQKTWDLKLRLSKWESNNKNFKNGKQQITSTDEFKQIVTAIRNDGERR